MTVSMMKINNEMHRTSLYTVALVWNCYEVNFNGKTSTKFPRRFYYLGNMYLAMNITRNAHIVEHINLVIN